MKRALCLVLASGCVAPEPVSEPQVEWVMGQASTEGERAGGARLAAGRWIGFQAVRVRPDAALIVEEDRRIVETGEEIRVRVGIHPQAEPGLYRVAVRSHALLLDDPISELRPGAWTVFRFVSDIPGIARVHVILEEVIRDMDALPASDRRHPAGVDR